MLVDVEQLAEYIDVMLFQSAWRYDEMGLVQCTAQERIVGMSWLYRMWVRAATTIANAVMYCRYWVAHPRMALTGGSQSGALSHRHSNTLATFIRVRMMVRRMLD